MARELTIGELSARSGVSQSALRFYERKGLIAADRSSGNQRRYPAVTLRRVALVQAGRTAGIPLQRIRAALDTLPRDRSPTKRDWERLSRSWRAELDERIATLEGIRGRLAGCIGCGCLSLRRCTLLNPGDEAAHDGPGAHYLLAPSSRPSTRGPRSGA
jgi:MerR family transcriptional regulator, redox-sensitive transcriptional activator SoxR